MASPSINVFFWLPVSIFLMLAIHPVQSKSFIGPEHELYMDLFNGYLSDSRPVKNASHTVVVTFALSLNQLLDLDEKNQVLTTSVWIFEEWIDELLTWNPPDYDGQTSIMIPATRIWLPDIFIFNMAGDGTDGFVNVNGSKVAIRHDGRVRWMVPLMVSSSCSVDVTYFPYDRQSCNIKFGSWIYDDRQLDIIVDTSEPDLEHYIMNSEYDLETVRVKRGVLNSTCCSGEGTHSIVEMSLALKRKSLYYDYIVIAPTIMLCVLTLASFLLPCDRGEKMAIGLTVFLTLYVLQLRIADNVPDTNSTPILGIFMLIVMTFNCVSLIMAAVVMNIKKRGDDVTCPDVPKWLFATAHYVFGKVVCTRFLWADEITVPHESTVAAKSKHPYDNCCDCQNIQGNPVDSSVSRSSPQRALGADFRETPPGHQLEMTNRGTGDTSGCGDGPWQASAQAREETSLLSHNLMANCVCSQRKDSRGTQAFRGTAENLRIRKGPSAVSRDPLEQESLLHQGREDPSAVTPWSLVKQTDHAILMKRRWFYVAEVVDKFAFLVYLVLLTTSIFTVLFLIPVYFRNDSKMMLV